jgi:chromosome segregation ATPase
MTTVNRDEFETVKELLASAARYAESANERIDHTQQQLDQLGVKIDALTTAQDRTQRQLDTLAANQINERDERLSLKEDLEILFQTVRQTDRTVAQLTDKVDGLTNSVVGLSEQLEQQAQQAEQDRSQAAIDRSEFRSTVTQLLQVLTQQMNGNGRAEG